MKFGNYLLAASVALLITSCSFKKKEKAPVFIEPALLDTIYNNAYEGIIPCPDCPGIETVIRIFNDSTISRTIYYQGRNSLPETRIGTWKLKDSIFEASFDREKLFYKIKNESTILRVGSDLKEVEGKLAKDYTLTKALPFNIKNVLGTYIQGDTLADFQRINISNPKKGNFILQFTHKAVDDTLPCIVSFNATLSKEHLLESSFASIHDSLKGSVKVTFTKHEAHVFYKDIPQDSLPLICKSKHINMQGSYTKQ